MFTVVTAGPSPCPPKATPAQDRPLLAARCDQGDAFGGRISVGRKHRRTPGRGVGSTKPPAAGRQSSNPTLLLAH
ncbi:hypothetical protein [Azohydromonas sediminis]|uniref:hypothetical protein n=1 Tax=Azohydromonas sediminis TaxID=2259674 RepID=UPI001B355A87|nr:hypothetical protein [Azohydromonas sediminis]